jgi:hypothetical protein
MDLDWSDREGKHRVAVEERETDGETANEDSSDGIVT